MANQNTDHMTERQQMVHDKGISEETYNIVEECVESLEEAGGDNQAINKFAEENLRKLGESESANRLAHQYRKLLANTTESQYRMRAANEKLETLEDNWETNRAFLTAWSKRERRKQESAYQTIGASEADSSVVLRRKHQEATKKHQNDRDKLAEIKAAWKVITHHRGI